MSMAVTCKLGEKGCWEDGKCRLTSYCENQIVTYADLIRSMNDEELAEYIIDVIIEAYEHVNIPVNNRCEAIRDYLKALKQPVEDAE